jgi:hypothetical protein
MCLINLKFSIKENFFNEKKSQKKKKKKKRSLCKSNDEEQLMKQPTLLHLAFIPKTLSFEKTYNTTKRKSLYTICPGWI